MKVFVLIPLIFVTQLSAAQTVNRNFTLVDKRVKSIQSNSVGALSKKLVSPYKTQLEKVRSIFKWITENIEYDVVGPQNLKGVYTDLYRPTISTIDSVRQRDYNERIFLSVLNVFRQAYVCNFVHIRSALSDSVKGDLRQ